MAAVATSRTDEARARYQACVRRRRIFEAHRKRKREAFDRRAALAEAAAHDEANLFSHEARSRAGGNIGT
ncbi:MAG: hypothetical protein NVS2B3_06700 [Vulcanimicrobiaceae bacterium]